MVAVIRFESVVGIVERRSVCSDVVGVPRFGLADGRSLFRVEADCLVAPDQYHARDLLLGGVVYMIVDGI